MKREVEEWLNFADRDILAAAELIANAGLTQIVAFHCQQAVEKYFKAYLLEHDKPLIKTHDLIQLYGLIKDLKDFEIDERKLKAIDAVYVETRYPGDIGLLPDGLPTTEEAKEFLEFTQEIEKIIKKELC